MAISIEYILDHAKNDDGLSIKNSIAFHYLNDDGLYAQSVKQQDRIKKLVNDGIVKSGWLLAYDNHFHYKEMTRLHRNKQVSRIQYNVWISMFVDHVEKLEILILEQEG